MTMKWLKGDTPEGHDPVIPLDQDPLLPPELQEEDVERILDRATRLYWQLREIWSKRGSTVAKPSENVILYDSTVERDPLRGEVLVGRPYRVDIRHKTIRAIAWGKRVDGLEEGDRHRE